MNIRFIVASMILIVLAILKQVHIMQLNSYNLDQQLIWYKKNLVTFSFNLALLISAILFYELSFIPAYFLIIISLIGMLIENLPRKQKKKLVFTARIKRLMCTCVVIFLILTLGFLISTKNVKYILYITALSPVVIFISYLICLPIENLFRRKFMNEASDIIKSRIEAAPYLYTIGITGSFGKTSVKYYLSNILKSKYSVCMTPESYNTPMGAVLTIKNDLKNINDVFICEMGARRVGDVKEICDIVLPFSCIVTDVGNMHLDTFKNIDNVLKTKFELVEAVNDNANKSGYILLNGDNKLIRDKAKEYEKQGRTVFFYGLDESNDFYARETICDEKGTKFIFAVNTDKTKSDGNKIDKLEFKIETRLLGKYNIMNLVAAISFSLLLNVDKDEIVSMVKKIEAVPHRLQLLSYDQDNIIIDDAYNSNPRGARNAVDVLASFEGYIKVIITPGMVELYDKQDMENESFAEYAGKKVDYAIVVGHTNRLALDRGFEKSLDKEKIIDIEKVEAAIDYARNNISGRKVILLENDLSDNY